MELLDALSTFQFGKKNGKPHRLITPFGEKLDPEHVLEEYPRPQMRRGNWECLNGFWEYAFTGDQKRPERMDGQILVPFPPESILSGVERRLLPGEYLWYRRMLPLGRLPEGKRLLLHFGAVDQDCVVYVNRRRAGGHLGGYTSFSLDITEWVREGENELLLKVRDETDRGWQTRGKQKLSAGGMFYSSVSGIWQTVWTEWVPRCYIRRLVLTPDLDRGCVTVRAELSGVPAGQPGPLCRVRVGDGAWISFSGGRVTVPVREAHLWSPEDPYLYDVAVEAGEDRVESYFAMRKFSRSVDEQGISRLYLNNRPYFQNGVLDQGYWPDGLYTAPSDEALVYDIRTMKELGFNMIRKHLKVEPARWYYHCDRLGMIVWQDLINGGGRSIKTFLLYLPTVLPFVTARFSDHWYPLFSRTSRTGRRRWLAETRELVRQLESVPSIALWVAFNEGWGQFDAGEVTAFLRRLDSTRLVDHASGWYDQGAGDVKSVHNYFRKLKVEPEERPFAFTEYGGYTCYVAGHSYSDDVFGYKKYPDPAAYSAAMDALSDEISALVPEGLAAAVCTQASDVEEEVNGILTYDRRVCKWRKRCGET